MGNHTFMSVLVSGILILFANITYAGDLPAGCTIVQEGNVSRLKCPNGLLDSSKSKSDSGSIVPWKSAEAKAQGQQRAAASTTLNNKYKNSSCSSMEIPLEALDYVEINFATELRNSGGSCEVVPGKTDASARPYCPGGYLINPGNPQYRTGTKRGDLSSNDLGYYFCLRSKTKSFNKRVLCEEMRANQQCKMKPLEIQFITRGGGDGDCMCGPLGTDKMHLKDCSQANLSEIAGEEVKCDESVGMMSNPNYKNSSSGQSACICDAAKGYKEDGKGSCTPPDKVATTAAPGEIRQELIKCVQGFEERAAKCESAAIKAKKTCDQENSENSEVNDAIGATNIVNEAFQRQNQGKDAVAECIRAGALARSPQILMDALKKKCDANFEECNKSCTDEDVQNYTKECGDIANKAANEEVSKGITPNNNKNVIYFRERLEVVKKGQESGAKMCKEDASATRNIFSKVLAGLGESYAQGQKCACQFASTSLGTTQSTCNSLPTAEQCLANPSLAGCAPVISVDICSPGSQNYSYQGCKCQQDPKAVGCPQYAAATPGLSGFAGTDVGAGSSGGGASFGAGTGGSPLSAGDLNLNGNNAGEAASGNKSGALGGGFGGPAAAGGAGGLGGIPGGGPEAGAGAAGDDGDKGSSGAFGFMKTMAGNLFGGGGAGNKKNESGKGGGVGSKFDPNKYRPNRGLAQEYGVGNKNSELWQLMHDGYEMNQPTFIPNP